MHSVAPFFHRPPNLIPTLASLTTLMDRPRNSRDEYALGNTPFRCDPVSSIHCVRRHLSALRLTNRQQLFEDLTVIEAPDAENIHDCRDA